MNILAPLSLITAFVGGIVALFAPCCITFLLPTYLANIFKEKDRVVWATLMFGLGIATVLVPTALGIRAIGQLFDRYHTLTYVIGGVFMILLGAMELTGKKISLPMLNISLDINTRHDPVSIYLLGVISGVTTSCCTPVLAGVLTISFLSPSLFWAGLAGFSYVLGMITPLIVMALLLEKINWTSLPRLRSKTLSIGDKHVLVTDFIAGILYMTVGLVFSTLALAGKINPGTSRPIEQTIGTNAMFFIRTVRNIPYAEYIFAVLLIVFIIFLIRKGKKS